jgi:glucose-1-phosphatase
VTYKDDFPIRHILFDLGAVLLNIDYQLPVRAFAELGMKDFDRLFAHAGQSDLFNRWERGEVSRAAFAAEIRQISGLNLSEANIFRAWNTILLDLPEHRIRFLESLHDRFTVSLLSNTNEVHVEAFEEIADRTIGIQRWRAAFNGKIFYSNQIGLRKPDRETFRFVLESTGFSPDETLFIDDTPGHVRGAEAVGIRGLVLPHGKEVKQALSDWFGMNV